MKNEIIVDVHGINDLEKFVSGMNGFKCDVDAFREHHIADAKSFLGVMDLAFRPFTVRINTDNREDIKRFNDFCKEYHA